MKCKGKPSRWHFRLLLEEVEVGQKRVNNLVKSSDRGGGALPVWNPNQIHKRGICNVNCNSEIILLFGQFSLLPTRWTMARGHKDSLNLLLGVNGHYRL